MRSIEFNWLVLWLFQVKNSNPMPLHHWRWLHWFDWCIDFDQKVTWSLTCLHTRTVSTSAAMRRTKHCLGVTEKDIIWKKTKGSNFFFYKIDAQILSLHSRLVLKNMRWALAFKQWHRTLSLAVNMATSPMTQTWPGHVQKKADADSNRTLRFSDHCSRWLDQA